MAARSLRFRSSICAVMETSILFFSAMASALADSRNSMISSTSLDAVASRLVTIFLFMAMMRCAFASRLTMSTMWLSQSS